MSDLCECGHPWGEHYDAWACLTCAEDGGTCPVTEEILSGDTPTTQPRAIPGTSRCVSVQAAGNGPRPEHAGPRRSGVTPSAQGAHQPGTEGDQAPVEPRPVGHEAS